MGWNGHHGWCLLWEFKEYPGACTKMVTCFGRMKCILLLVLLAAILVSMVGCTVQFHCSEHCFTHCPKVVSNINCVEITALLQNRQSDRFC